MLLDGLPFSEMVIFAFAIGAVPSEIVPLIVATFLTKSKLLFRLCWPGPTVTLTALLVMNPDFEAVKFQPPGFRLNE